MKLTIRRAIIALDFESLDAPGLASFSRTIAGGLTNNSNFTATDLAKLPWAVTDIQSSAAKLDTIRTARGTAPSKANTKLERDQANTLMGQIKDIAGTIETIANTKAAGDYNLAAAIIVSVGFKLRKTPAPRAVKGFTIDSTSKSTIDVHFPKAPKGAVRVFIYSLDGGKTWSSIIVIHGQDLIINGLKSGTEVQGKFAIVLPPANRAKVVITAGNEAPAWSDPVTCVVK
jgi:hypothetical protein